MVILVTIADIVIVIGARRMHNTTANSTHDWHKFTFTYSNSFEFALNFPFCAFVPCRRTTIQMENGKFSRNSHHFSKTTIILLQHNRFELYGRKKKSFIFSNALIYWILKMMHRNATRFTRQKENMEIGSFLKKFIVSTLFEKSFRM